MNSVSRRKSYLVVGILGLTLSGAYLAGALRLPMGDLGQPGAGVFPVMVAVTLIIASFLTLAEGWSQDDEERVALPAGADAKRLLILIALMVGYITLMPWLGQALASLLFCILLLRLLSDLSWLRIMVYAALMAAALYVVFIYLLKIPMPSGFFGAD